MHRQMLFSSIDRNIDGYIKRKFLFRIMFIVSVNTSSYSLQNSEENIDKYNLPLIFKYV